MMLQSAFLLLLHAVCLFLDTYLINNMRLMCVYFCVCLGLCKDLSKISTVHLFLEVNNEVSSCLLHLTYLTLKFKP